MCAPTALGDVDCQTHSGRCYSVIMKISKLQGVTQKICDGDFRAADVGLLLIWLRPSLNPSADPLLLDLSNFVAHSEGRDRGASFDYVNSYIKNLIAVSERGGTLVGRASLFTRADTIGLLIKKLKSINVAFDEQKLAAQGTKLIECIYELLEETDLKIEDPRIIRCYLKKTDQGVKFCIEANLIGPAIRLAPGAVWQCNFFD